MSIWCLLHSVKSTVKILSIFVAFLENINFKGFQRHFAALQIRELVNSWQTVVRQFISSWLKFRLSCLRLHAVTLLSSGETTLSERWSSCQEVNTLLGLLEYLLRNIKESVFIDSISVFCFLITLSLCCCRGKRRWASGEAVARK